MKSFNSNKKLFCAFADYEKCFDKIDRTYLWQNLLTENVSSKIVKSLKAMYNTVKSCIRYKSELSDFVDSNIGVKQGDPSSSLLFLFFVNDIVNNFNMSIDGLFSSDELKLFMILFADDAVIFAQSPTALQSLLDDLYHYCTKWGIRINTNKTKIMIFEKGRNSNNRFKICNTELETVTSFKYLGIYLFKNGQWNRTQKIITQHASYAMHNLFTTFNQLELLTSDKVKLFDSLVGSVLNYSAEVWGNYESIDIERLHCKFIRKILCVKNSTNIDGLYGEIGRFPMKIQRKLIMIKYWLKLVKSNNMLTKSIYEILKRDADNNITYGGMNWAFQIKNILEESGLGYLWQNQNLYETDFLFIKQRIIDIFKQTWYSNINNSRRLATYSVYKHDLVFEKYLDAIKINKYRIALSKFRLSSHDLAIETGRYTNIRIEDRKCNQCNLIEDEYHFLLVCPKYRHLRQNFFKPFYRHWPNLYKLESLMTSTSRKTIENLSKYIYHAFKLRNNENNT
jgi:hypothetical protein